MTHARKLPMQSYQWFLLGMMAAWTPGLLLLAWTLRPGAIDDGYHLTA